MSFSLCSGQLWLFFTVGCLEDYYEKSEIKCLLRKYETVLGKVVSWTFDKKKEWFIMYHSEFLPGPKVQYCLYRWKPSSSYYF